MVEEVVLYRSPTTEADADAVADCLDERVDADVSVRDRFLSVSDRDDLAESFAGLPDARSDPMSLLRQC